MKAMGKKPKVEIEQSNCKQSDVSMMLTKYILKDKNCNVVFSPLPLKLVLALIAAGSRGQVLKQLLSFLGAQTTKELNSRASCTIDNCFAHDSPFNDPSLSLANSVWIDKSLSVQPLFKKVLEDLYKAASHVLDFIRRTDYAIDILDSWVEEKTNGLFRTMVPPNLFRDDTEEIKILFASVVYFKASLVDLRITQNIDFHLLNNSRTVKVPFMTSSNKSRLISVFDGFKVLGLPCGGAYRNFQTTMYIFLPDANDGLATLVDKLGSEPGFLDLHIPHETKPLGELWIPKFKISFGFEASKTLKALGLSAAFVPGGLDKMVNSLEIELPYVSNIFQQSYIEVNESGTGACVGAVFRLRGGADPPPLLIDFVANHPFLFLIRENQTGVVLFVGQVLNPLAT